MTIKEKCLSFVKYLYSKVKQYKVYILTLLVLMIGFYYNNYSYRKKRMELFESEKSMKSRLFFDTKFETFKNPKERVDYLIKNEIFNDIVIKTHQDNKTMQNLTLIDYSSYNCQFCRKMRADIQQVLKWADENNVKFTYVLRPITNKRSIIFNVFLSCIKDNRDKYVEDFFKIDWLTVGDLRDYLTKFAIDNSLLTEDEVKSCLNDDSIYRKIIYYQLQSNIAFDTTSTPLLIINGKKSYGYKDYKKIIKMLGGYAD